MYFAERQLTCQRKTQLELICADGLGGNDREVAYVIATDKQTQIFLDEEEAKVSQSWPNIGEGGSRLEIRCRGEYLKLVT